MIWYYMVRYDMFLCLRNPPCEESTWDFDLGIGLALPGHTTSRSKYSIKLPPWYPRQTPNRGSSVEWYPILFSYSDDRNQSTSFKVEDRPIHQSRSWIFFSLQPFWLRVPCSIHWLITIFPIRNTAIYIYIICMYVYIYICMYVYRDREMDRYT